MTPADVKRAAWSKGAVPEGWKEIPFSEVQTTAQCIANGAVVTKTGTGGQCICATCGNEHLTPNALIGETPIWFHPGHLVRVKI